jgi:hypothetical protein
LTDGGGLTAAVRPARRVTQDPIGSTMKPPSLVGALTAHLSSKNRKAVAMLAL